MGKDTWRQAVISNILTNEKYKGDALLQKRVTVDFLNHKLKKNEGEAPQYYVEGNHDAIIAPDVFDMVQMEIEKRRNGKYKYSGVSIFSSKMKCGDCGAWYGSKVWHSTDKYRRVVYRCNSKYDDGHGCQTPHVTEEEIKTAFIRALNQLLADKDEILKNISAVRKMLCKTADLEKEKDSLTHELDILGDMIQNTVFENARVAQDQDDYKQRYDSLVEKYESIQARLNEVNDKIADRQAKALRLSEFAKELRKRDGVIEEFDERLWGILIEYVEVGRNKKLKFCFCDGTQIVL